MKETRWQQRFENFERAFLLLRSVFEERTIADLSDLEREGVVQRFDIPSSLLGKP